MVSSVRIHSQVSMSPTLKPSMGSTPPRSRLRSSRSTASHSTSPPSHRWSFISSIEAASNLRVRHSTSQSQPLLHQALNVILSASLTCAQGEGCADADPMDMMPAIMSATAPTINADATTVHRGTVDGDDLFRISVAGSDAEDDVVGFRIEFLDAEGADVYGQPAALHRVRNRRLADGQYAATGTYRFPEGAEGEITTIRLTIIDNTDLRASVELNGFSAVTVLAVDDVCTPGDFTAVCGDPARAANGDGATRQELPTMCPTEWDVIDLNAHEIDGEVFNGRTLATPRARLILVMGVSAAVVLVADQQVASLTTMAGGVLTCELTTGNDEDTLMFARSHCGVVGPDAELACNDDADAGDLGFESRIIYPVEAGDVSSS